MRLAIKSGTQVSMTGRLARPEQAMDGALAEALRTGTAPAQAAAWTSETIEIAVRRALYHGISGLLAPLPGWPTSFLAPIRAEAFGRAMWELRHRQLLGSFLNRLGRSGKRALLLKGTALAYSLYHEPAERSRGDSDLWVPETEVEEIRDILAAEGFSRDVPDQADDPLLLEEGWTLIGADGNAHSIDLHWSAINSAALSPLFEFEDCWGRRQALASLSDHGWVLGHADALLHTAIHRQLHVVSPYQVGGLTYHGGDRLIWAKDLALLAGALGGAGLRDAAERAACQGFGAVLGDALGFARDNLGAKVDVRLLSDLARAPRLAGTRYLEGGPLLRALLDLKAVPTFGGKVGASARKIFASGDFLAAKYNDRRRWRLPLLFVRRLVGLVRARPSGVAR